jgi:hypothetical protein
MSQAPLGPGRFYREAYQAVTDFGFYRTVFQQPLRRTFLYLFYLAASIALALTLIYAWQYADEFDSFWRWAETNLPALEVRDGELSVEADQPTVRTYHGREEITFVFNSDAGHLDAEQVQEPGALFTREALFIRLGGRTQSYRWKDYDEFRLSPPEMRQVEHLIKWAYFPLSYSFFFIYNLISKAFHALLLTLFGVSATARYAVRLPFRQYFTIALYALTPAILIDLAVTMTGMEISYFFVIYLGTGAIYTYMASQRAVASE